MCTCILCYNKVRVYITRGTYVNIAADVYGQKSRLCIHNNIHITCIIVLYLYTSLHKRALSTGIVNLRNPPLLVLRKYVYLPTRCAVQLVCSYSRLYATSHSVLLYAYVAYARIYFNKLTDAGR